MNGNRIVMHRFSLLFLRASIGYLLAIWGVDKIVNPSHGTEVSTTYYFDALTFPALLPAFGALQIAVGFLVIAGFSLRYLYPVVLAMTGATLIGVWRSVVDPWGWYLNGAVVLFYPSLIIFAATLVLFAEERARQSSEPHSPSSSHP